MESISNELVCVAEIKSLFVHPFLAERMISMLNDFLQHLVGPKMGALKVKDFSEFDFKPQQLVSDICTIYLNLGYVVCWGGRCEVACAGPQADCLE